MPIRKLGLVTKLIPRVIYHNVQGAQIEYLARDIFDTPVAAGGINGTDADPGPGTRTVVDTNSIISIADGVLKIDGTTAINDRIYWDLFDLSAGRAFAWDVPVRNLLSTGIREGLTTHTSTFSTWLASLRHTTVTRLRVSSANITVFDDYTLGENEHRFVIIVRPNGGMFLFGRNGLSGDFTLLWVYPPFAAPTARFRLMTDKVSVENLHYDNIHVHDMSGVYAEDFGLATNHVAVPVDGEVTTQIAEGIVEVTWTPAAAEVLDIQVRRTDDNNCWIVRCDQANSRIYLYQKQTGTETERGATGGIATTFTAATPYRIGIRCYGARILVVVNAGETPALKQNYSSASFNQTATGVKLDNLTGTAADLATWPLAVSLPAPFDSMTLAESSTLARVSQQTLWSASGSHDWLGRAVLVELANGTWLTVYRSAALHSADTAARLHVRFSTDEGVVWTDEDTFTNGSPVTGMPLAPQVASKSLPEPVAFQCPNGDIIIHSYERAGGGTSQWRSTDNGATFTYDGVIADATATLTATEIVASDDYVIVGTDVYLIARLDPSSDFSHPHYLVILKSDDNAATWDYVAHVEATLDCNEAGIFNPSGNNLYVTVKDTNNFGTYIYRSADLGVTWGAREYITDQVGILNKPKCKSFGGYHWLYGRDVRSDTRTVVYRSADGMDWEARFYPFTNGYESEDNGYCDILPRANGDIYMLSYAGTEATAAITEAVFEEV